MSLAKTAFELKAQLLRSAMDRRFAASLQDHYADPENYEDGRKAYLRTMSPLQLQHYAEEETRGHLRCIRYAITEAEPILVPLDVASQIMGLRPETNNQELVVPDDIENYSCPAPEDLPLTSGLFLFPRPLYVSDRDINNYEPDAPPIVRAVTGLLYWCVESTRGRAITTHLWLHPEFSHMQVKLNPGLYANMIPRLWHKGVTVREYLRDLDVSFEKRKDSYVFELNPEAIEAWMLTFLVSTWRYMLKPAEVLTTPTIDKAARKTAQKHNTTNRVQIMVWRKPVPQTHEGPPGEIDWSCRWPVREHIRRYKSGKVVTIKSYVKGPPDKPMKELTPRIHVVDR